MEFAPFPLYPRLFWSFPVSLARFRLFKPVWLSIYTVSQKNYATFIFTVTLANVGRFLKFFYCRNQKEIADNKKEKFPTTL